MISTYYGLIVDLSGIALLALIWVFFCFIGHGYANTIDTISLALHRHAVKIRRMHARRTAVVQESWVRQLEADGQPEDPMPDSDTDIEYLPASELATHSGAVVDLLPNQRIDWSR